MLDRMAIALRADAFIPRFSSLEDCNGPLFLDLEFQVGEVSLLHPRNGDDLLFPPRISMSFKRSSPPKA